MGLILDIIILAIIVINVFVYIKRGLTGVVIDIAGFVFSALVSWYLSPYLGKWISLLIKKIVPDDRDGFLYGALTSGAVSRIIAFIALFFIMMSVVSLIVKLTKNIKIPIISSADRLLGGILGLLLGFAWAYVASVLICVLLAIISSLIPSFPTSAFDSMRITRWFFELKLFGF